MSAENKIKEISELFESEINENIKNFELVFLTNRQLLDEKNKSKFNEFIQNLKSLVRNFKNNANNANNANNEMKKELVESKKDDFFPHVNIIISEMEKYIGSGKSGLANIIKTELVSDKYKNEGMITIPLNNFKVNAIEKGVIADLLNKAGYYTYVVENNLVVSVTQLS